MAPSLKLFFAVLFLLSISAQGRHEPCGLSSIQVRQRTPGAAIEGLDFEFVVEIKNLCSCAQRDVRLNAPGFASQRSVDPKLFRRAGDTFLVYDGKPIAAGETVRFWYRWDRATYFTPAGSQTVC